MDWLVNKRKEKQKHRSTVKLDILASPTVWSARGTVSDHLETHTHCGIVKITGPPPPQRITLHYTAAPDFSLSTHTHTKRETLLTSSQKRTDLRKQESQKEKVQKRKTGWGEDGDLQTTVYNLLSLTQFQLSLFYWHGKNCMFILTTYFKHSETVRK